MKNKFLVNNKNVPFVDIVDNISDTTAENLLISDFNEYSFAMSSDEFIELSLLENGADVIVNPLDSKKYDQDEYTNIKKSFFSSTLIDKKSELFIPEMESNIGNEFCDITFNVELPFDNNYGTHPIITDKIHKIYTSKPISGQNRLHIPLSKTVDDKEQLTSFGTNYKATLVFDYVKPTLINSFSVHANNIEYSNDTLEKISNGTLTLDDLKFSDDVFTLRDAPVLTPQLRVKILAYSELTDSLILLVHRQMEKDWASVTKIYLWYTHRWYLRQYKKYLEWPDITFDKIGFVNNKRYSSYKMTIETESLNTLTHICLDRNLTDIVDGYVDADNVAYKQNESSTISTHSNNIKDIGYILSDMSKDVVTKATTVLSNLKIDIDNTLNSIDLSFLINPTYKWSYKYGDLVSGITLKFVTYDLNNFDTVNDSTTILTKYVEITNVADIVNINLITEEVNILNSCNNLNVIFIIHYDIDRFKTLFEESKLEDLNTGFFINNYDYNLKPNNTGTFSNTWPKKLTMYKVELNNPTEISTITKKNVTTVNCPKTTESITVKMDNKLVGKVDLNQVYTGIGDFLQNSSSPTNELPLLGLLEVAQCNGNSITKRDYIDKNGDSQSIKNKPTTKILQTYYYVEQLDYSNAFELKLERGINRTILTEHVYSATIPLNKISILPDTKYFIVKILLKIKPHLETWISDRAQPFNMHIYKAITVNYDVPVVVDTVYCNDLDEIKSNLLDDSVAYYKLNRGILL